MTPRSASRWFIAALFAVSAAVPMVGAGAAAAAQAQPAHWHPGGGYGDGYGDGGYHHYRHHHGNGNCNNDPDSPYAMGPDCPYSHNSEYSPYGGPWDD